MIDVSWQDKLTEFVHLVQDITSGLRRWVPNLDNSNPGTDNLSLRISGMPESDDVSSEMEDMSPREGGNKKQKNDEGKATDNSPLV